MAILDEQLAWAVEHEEKLLWRGDPLTYPYLRQSVRAGYQWWGPVATGRRWAAGSRVVGYAVLSSTASSRGTGKRVLVYRRIFWCKLSDRDGGRSAPPVREAVDPRLIRDRELTPWLFDNDSAYDFRQLWLTNRRVQLGLGPGQQASP